MVMFFVLFLFLFDWKILQNVSAIRTRFQTSVIRTESISFLWLCGLYTKIVLIAGNELSWKEKNRINCCLTQSFYELPFVILVIGLNLKYGVHCNRDSWIKHIIAMNSLQVSADVGVSVYTAASVLNLRVKWLLLDIHNWTCLVLLTACETFGNFFLFVFAKTKGLMGKNSF